MGRNSFYILSFGFTFSTLNFKFPSCLSSDLCPSHLYNCRERFTNQPFLCKTKPILSAVGGLQMNVSPVITRKYENKSNWTLGENKANTKPIKPNTNPIKANFRKAKMNVSLVKTRNYNNEQRTMNYELLLKTNPIKPNFKPGALSQLTFTLLPCPAGSGVPLAICAVPKDGLHTLPLLFGLLWFFSSFSSKPPFLTFFFWILPFLCNLLIDNIHNRV